MKKKIILNLLCLTVLTAFALPLISSAQQGAQPPSGVQGAQPPGNQSYKIIIPNPLGNKQDSLPALLKWLIQEAIVPIGGIIAALMIMYAGFLYVTARGNDTKIKTAHNALLYAAIGTAILLGAEVLAAAIQGTVNQIGG